MDKLSRKLVAVCRADAKKFKGLVHRSDGCLPADKLFALLNIKHTEEDLIKMIEEQERLGYKRDEDTGKLWIYCYQGILDEYMSPNGPVEREKLYTKVVVDSKTGVVLYHSTREEHKESILLNGLGMDKKRDIHLWGEDNKKKGKKGSDCLIEVNASLLVLENPEVVVWVAGNGVHLIETNIAPKYLCFL